ncbi:hypothetical protein JHK85_004875 [Glycine max]|nr:hypothetical protein JHK85_004875 [Glycine max]
MSKVFNVFGAISSGLLPEILVLLGISGVELDILDEFKDVEYTRTDVEVSLKDKSERLQVCAYVWSNPNDPNLYAEWDFECAKATTWLKS